MGAINSVVRVRNVVVLAVADVVLFVVANATAKSSSHPGTASNVVFVAFLIGLLMLFVLGIWVLVRHGKTAARPA